MTDSASPRSSERWAHLRFSIIGPLLAAPPAAGELKAEIEVLADKTWRHPVNGQPCRFAFSTIERWYHRARRQKSDPVSALKRKVRSDAGRQASIGGQLHRALLDQYAAHKNWSCRLHYDNLIALVAGQDELGVVPSYSTVRRFMLAQGLVRRPRRAGRDTDGWRRAESRLEQREVRSFEVEHVHGLWHLDFHHGSRKILDASGQWMTPMALGVLDDRSRLACHVQWYCSETAGDLVHGLCQAFQKRGLPRSLLTDNGSAMTAGETVQGLLRLGIIHHTTLPYSPYQNAKQEVFWAQLEGRLMAMLEGVEDLTLAGLNEATQAWVELEYQRRVHSETGQTPVERCALGPDVGRPCPDSQALRLAFTTELKRTQRRSDGTITLAGRRFEIPSRYRTLSRVILRYAAWDLAQVYLTDERSGDLLCRLLPLDKAKNADGRRRALTSVDASADQPAPRPVGMAPLLQQLIAEYAATGLPPAYLPQSAAETAVEPEQGATHEEIR
jgi:transposase InsO family protein